MRIRRASMSVMRSAAGSSVGDRVLHPLARIAAAAAKWRFFTCVYLSNMRAASKAPAAPKRLTIDELDAPIQAPRFVIAPCLRRTLLAIDHRRELRAGGALQHQHAAHGLRTAL